MFLLLACFNEAINSLLINFASDYFITSNSPFSVTLSEKQSPGSAATGVCVCAFLLPYVYRAKKWEGVCPVPVCSLTWQMLFCRTPKG